MRDLTEEELKLAPDWATHYQVSESNYLIWESKDKYQTPIMRAPKKQKSKLTKCKKIPVKKPFDISEHEFSDEMSNLKAMLSGRGDVVIRIGSSWIFLDKSDSIAIAKALGVTGGDLL